MKSTKPKLKTELDPAAPVSTNLDRKLTDATPASKVPSAFTGIAKSVECFWNQGHKDFRIITLKIVDGVIVDTHLSDAYASFEAIIKLEQQVNSLIIHLNNHWAHGAAWEKKE